MATTATPIANIHAPQPRTAGPGSARLWRVLIGAQWRHHPWRQAAAVLAIALGVALAFAVHLINASALAEFGQAVRTVNGQPDLILRATAAAGFDEALYARVAAHPQVAWASPVVEVDTIALGASGPDRVSVRVLGIDALVAPQLAPALLPRPREGADRLALLDPQATFLNPAARQALGLAAASSERPTLRLQSGSGLVTLQVQGDVAVPGGPLVVMDIAGAQAAFGRLGRLSRLDLRLAPGAAPEAVWRELDLPASVRRAEPEEAQQRVSNLSRSYRVNLTVLALVALFTGAFLVFTVQALSTAQRLGEIALLGVLGLGARGRRRWLLVEAGLIGLVGATLGLLLGAGLALAALVLLGGDLGNGPFGAAATPALQIEALPTLLYGGLGVVAALLGGWMPARAVEQIAPAEALKGYSSLADSATPRHTAWAGAGLVALGVALAFLPPWGELPLAAYLSVACLLLGGIAAVPWIVGAGLSAARVGPRHPVTLLALRRAHDQRHVATAAVAGVVASLSLAAALTVMVASFRGSVASWLDQVLPADLYLRSATQSAQADSVFLDAALVARIGALPGVARLQPQRVVPLVFDAARTPVALLAREVADDGADLPLVGTRVAANPPLPSVYASETFAALYGAAPGQRLDLPLPDGRRVPVWLRGLWRDYARQQGALVIGREDWLALTGDARINDLGIGLAPGADPDAVRAGVRTLLPDPGLVEMASAGEIRAISLRIFDRSFAVTRWLQGVAIAIGLAGIAASFSAQVLARRKEFGVLQHLGLTRRQVLGMVAAEGALWTACGALLGLALGLAVALVLVHVVNPQSFHWTMELRVPTAALAALAGAVVAAGSATAWLAGRAAATREMALAVKEDW